MKKTNSWILCMIGAFGFCAAADAAILMDEPFTYTDGALATVSGGVWTQYSGTGGQTVVSNKLALDDNSTGDNSRPFSAITSGFIFSSFTFQALALDPPSSATTGGYFFGLQATSSGLLSGRVAAYRPTGSTDGKYTLAVGSNSATTTFTNWGAELSLDTTYTVVTKFDLATGDVTLWVDPVDETSTGVVSAGNGVIASLSFAAFRIGATSDGDKIIDDLKVGTTFADVAPVPEPGVTALLGLGFGLLVWRTMRRRVSA